MTKEEILALNLSASEKTLVENAFTAAERFGKTCKLVTCADEAAIKVELTKMDAAYKKRKEAEARKASKSAAAQEETKKVVDLLHKANGLGFTTDEVIKAINDMIKQKNNEKINAKIAELQAQLME